MVLESAESRGDETVSSAHVAGMVGTAAAPNVAASTQRDIHDAQALDVLSRAAPGAPAQVATNSSYRVQVSLLPPRMPTVRTRSAALISAAQRQQKRRRDERDGVENTPVRGRNQRSRPNPPPVEVRGAGAGAIIKLAHLQIDVEHSTRLSVNDRLRRSEKALTILKNARISARDVKVRIISNQDLDTLVRT